MQFVLEVVIVPSPINLKLQSYRQGNLIVGVTSISHIRLGCFNYSLHSDAGRLVTTFGDGTKECASLLLVGYGRGTVRSPTYMDEASRMGSSPHLVPQRRS